MKLDQYFNLHSHTSRCGHAYGTDKEYVLAAIEAGFTELGFSDHVMLPGVSQVGTRAEYSMLEDYVRSVTKLRRRYRDKIDIHVGFEAEWYGDTFKSYYQKLLDEGIVEYLILGQHCCLENGTLRWYATLDPSTRIRRYTDDLIAGMDSGLFLYVCHPDTFLRWHGVFDEEARQCSVDICQAAVRNNIPLEINLSVGRYAFERLQQEGSLDYPCAMFWDIASELGVTCVYGVDAHRPSDYETTPYDFYERFACQHHLNLLRFSPLTGKK